jgi:imidazolonepropionase
MLVDGIGLLVTNDPELGDGPLGELRDAAVVLDGGRVAWVGPAAAMPEGAGDRRLDAGGRCVVPGFVDAHTHLVFAGDRAEEFAARLAGRPYHAGGIRTTVAATRAASTAELAANARRLAREALTTGTTTCEVKSGYGLTVADERRSLQVAAGLEDPDLPAVVATFLGAHVVPAEYEGRADDYVDLIAGPMLDACAPLASWCDAFCEDGAFDADRSRTVLRAGAVHGLGLRVHANQLRHGPGARLAAELGAASADHLTFLDDADVDALAGAGVVATLLPAAEFSTGSSYPPARRLLDAGVTVALATDCNPGTSYTTSMPFVVALACTQMAMTPAEALHAATVGGAAALRLPDAGRLSPGSRADLALLDAPGYVHLAYRPGVALVHSVARAGRVVYSRDWGTGSQRG